jgi:hypothetical protein
MIMWDCLLPRYQCRANALELRIAHSIEQATQALRSNAVNAETLIVIRSTRVELTRYI